MQKLNPLITFFVTLISIASLGKCSRVTGCPPEEEIAPCTCVNENEHLSYMQCDNLKENTQLHKSLQSLNNYNIRTLIVGYSNITPIDSGAFRGPRFGQIAIRNSTVFMESPQFFGQESSLDNLEISSCFDDENAMNSFDFSHLHLLRSVYFSYNVIRTLKNDWLTKASSALGRVMFSENSIRQLEDRVFEKVTGLADLIITDNEISSISRSMFPRPANDLYHMAFSNNYIENLPEDIFVEMLNLNAVSFEGNRIKTLQESIWQPLIRQAAFIFVGGNPLRCDRSLKWLTGTEIKDSDLGHCQEPEKLRGKYVKQLTAEDLD